MLLPAIAEALDDQEPDAEDQRNKDHDDEDLDRARYKSDKDNKVLDQRYKQSDEHQNAAPFSSCFHK